MNFRDGWTSAGTGFEGPTGDGMASMLLGNPQIGTRITTANVIESDKQAWAFYAQG